MSGKIQRPQQERQHEKVGICWCGDPGCGGGPAGSASISLNDVRFSNLTERSSESAAAMNAAMERAMREFLVPGVLTGTGRAFWGEPAKPAQPAIPPSYTAARKVVAEYLLTVEHDTAWSDIIGNDTARAALIEAIEEPVLHPELYAHYGMKPPKGVMLYGPPGCGKTLFAKAAAAAVGRIYGAKAEVLVVNGPAIQSPYIGETEKTIRAIFAFAREYRAHHGHPLTVFIDEAEVLFPDRTGRTRKVFSYEESNVAQFLSEMDGLNSVGAFVILATNRPEAIDEALLRDGRCDRKIKVERPTREAVEHIVRQSLTDAPLGDELDTLVMAGTESFYNPHYVIQEGRAFWAKIDAQGEPEIKDRAVNFCLEHIVSGAMVAGVGRRARARAFARDRKSGERSGIGVQDVLDAVSEIFEENKSLEHSFAVREFVDGLRLQLQEQNSRPQTAH